MSVGSQQQRTTVKETTRQPRSLLPHVAWFSLCTLIASWGPAQPISVRTIWGYAGLAGLTIAVGLSANRIRSLQKLVVIDKLTGLANRQLLEDLLKRDLARAARYGESFSLLFADIDHFKDINDTYGHATGDLVLQAVARAIQDACRNCDTVARCGGDELVVVLPHADHESAVEVADRVRAAVASLNVCRGNAETQGRLKVTVSLGIATFPDDGSDPASLLHHADMNLYSAKLAGRDRVASLSQESSLARSGAME